MGKVLQTNVDLSLRITHTNQEGISSPVDAYVEAVQTQWANGAGNDQADLFYRAELSLAGSPTELDLAGLLEDAFGGTIDMVKIRLIYIKNNATAAGYNVNVGGAAANPCATMFGDATHKIIVPPSGVWLLSNPRDGFAVTGETGDLLKLDPGANTIAVEVVIVGTSS